MLLCLHMLKSASHLSHTTIKTKNICWLLLRCSSLRTLTQLCNLWCPEAFKVLLIAGKPVLLCAECLATLTELSCKIIRQEQLEQVLSTVQVGIEFLLPLPRLLKFCRWVFYYPMTSHTEI